MLVTTTRSLLRVVEDALRRADADLARAAARNAASSLADRRARRLEDARTLRDLRQLEARTPDRTGSSRRP